MAIHPQPVRRDLHVLAVDVLVAVLPVVAGFGLYFLFRLCAA
jgi:hypothetical protein